MVVLGYRFWQRYYSGDPDIVGRTIQLVRKPYQIVGVMPPRFRWREADIYLPLKFTLDPNINFGVTLKLRPGISAERANAELQPLLEQFAKQSPTRYPDNFRVNLRSIIELYARPLGPTLYLLFGAVASLLLIGCANVSILLLARGAQRQHELAVRAALGAARGRIVRQLFTESLAIAVAGTALGILFAWKSLAFIIAWLPSNSFPAESVIEMNLPVLLFSAGLAFATAIVFGIAPALQLSRPDVARVVQSSTRRVMGSVHGKRTHQRHGGDAGRADTADAHRGGRRRQGIPAPGEYRPRLRSAPDHVLAHPDPRRHLLHLEGAVRILRADPRAGSRPCRR